MIYSTAYPIYYTIKVETLNKIEYNIKHNNKEIYKGVLYPIDLKPLQIDISPILREYLDTNYENKISNNTKIVNDVNKIAEFTVSNTEDEDDHKTIIVKYDYNYDYITELPNTDYINEPILQEVDSRQHLFICGYSIDSNYSYGYAINNTNIIKNDLKPIMATSMINLNLRDLNLRAGDNLHIKYYKENKIFKEFIYKVIGQCKNRYVIHYVNTKGGLDSLICSGKSEIRYSGKNTEVEYNDSYTDRKQFSNLPIVSRVTKGYSLNTGIIPDDRAELIYNLMDSPKIWVEDLETNTITAGMITDKSKVVKNYKNNKIVSYNINIEENQKYLRK